MDICTFWYGDRLRSVDWYCLSSMVKTGQKVKLYSHGSIENVPKGVELIDAEPILPLEILYRLDPEFPNFKPNRTIVQFSDFFRVMLMKHQAGVWLDTDVYLVKQFHPQEDEVWLARENRQRVGVSALYFPKDNPIIKEFEDYLKSDEMVPNWLGFRRRVWLPFLLRWKKLPVVPGRLGITVFGNDGISRLAKRHGFFQKAKEKKTFYYWTGRDAERIFDPSYGLEPLNDSQFIGFHVHKKAKTEQVAQEGSFYFWAKKQIDHMSE
ncbi:glycosyltransferase [Bartonella tamiae]|uniref:Alpha 1,4-glycosyltransferase domain-containing protein n=1 Tax=Bartonella tamiae Th239 TaxID=1094558 RepID=J0ZQ38_9HYPH|nr:glycosyltransferase [Bartonella tamiae]EJF90733.1 hypothetical protein ME5_01134 [Bartonella tamiae Th239]EJF93890.1 hypothetical protein MEG_00748 [Bartonella tamiae Th307]